MHADSSHYLPWIEHVGPVAPDVLGIQVQAGRVPPMRQIRYESRPGDRIEKKTHQTTGEVREARLVRDGSAVGFLAGRKRDILATFEELVGDPLDEDAADLPASYSIASDEDPAFGDGVQPEAVWRKTKVNNWTQPHKDSARRHCIYLKLPAALREGVSYRLRFPGLDLAQGELDYSHQPARTRSEAVHVSHVGFRPDDPGKCAFLSLWTGTGGGFACEEGLRFRLIDEDTDETVYEGEVVLAWPADRPEGLKREANYSGADVHRMDFGSFDRPGTYRVYVEGVGCSYPLRIADDVWAEAFRVSMKGHYHHRSGIELGPPHTDYVRPRCFHPGDGVVVRHSDCPLMYSGNGLNALGTDEGNFGNLIAGRTDEVVPHAWGGYMDAGDWDRRIQHVNATRLQLELVDLFPDYFAELRLGIPESGNGLPDVVNEALFNVDCYRRLQAPEGGVRGGIESSAHPVSGECSWQETQTVMSYAPGLWSSYVYAGVAARAAHVLCRFGPTTAALYRRSAARAMVWAEAEHERWPDRPEYPQVRQGALERVRDDRCLAAVELYRATGEERWHRLFLETTRLADEDQDLSDRQRDAAFVYARLGEETVNPALRQVAVDFCIRDAERGLQFARGNAWGLTTTYYDRPPQHGFYGMPGAIQIIRAHVLTADARYLEAAVRAAHFSGGANPMNLCMTTGVGHDWPRNPLHVDSRHSGQPAPAGITLYGPADYVHYEGERYWRWPFEVSLDEECTPPGSEWPITEGYFDVYSWAAVCEYTIQQTLGPNSYCWGYLAARR